MHSLLLLLLAISTTTKSRPDSFKECSKLFNPLNYLNQLPSLNLPYIDNIPIRPSKPKKVVSIVTKYVYKNPVCVKISGKKSWCKSPKLNDEDEIVTKELLVEDRRRKGFFDEELGVLQGSEQPRPFSKQEQTPELEEAELLVEDRLEHLEAVLPHYTRKKVEETRTITVTRVKNDNRATATLLVRNCVPQGYEVCPKKVKKRVSKVAKLDAKDKNFFG